jgi:hypothetical protein
MILLHPAMTGQEAHAWCQQHSSNLQVTHHQGKLHLLVVATPRQPDLLDHLEQHVKDSQ